MQVTEMLVTGYDGEESIFAVNLVSNAATVVLTSTDDNGETVVKSARQHATDSFAAVRDLLDCLMRERAASS